MRRKGQTTTLEERINIGERWKAGETDREIAKAMGCSIWTVRKWRRKYQQEGRSGLASRMGRPTTGALGHFPERVRETIDEMRKENPGWGPDTIRAEWYRDPARKDLPLPSRSRIAAYLNQEEYTRPYEPHSDLPQPEKKVVERVHEEWEIDAQGVVEVAGLTLVSVINIIDVQSRLKVESLACLDTSHPNTKQYQLALRRAFFQHGLPERISLDHDSVFYDNASPSPFPTTFHLWLIALGIDVRFIENPPPVEHSLIERTHQTMYRQAVADRTFEHSGEIQQRLTERRHFLNHNFPTRALGGRAPLEAYPEAAHSGRPYRPEMEEAMLDIERVCDYLAQGRWFRRTTMQGQFSLGGRRYNAGRDLGSQQLEITFDPQTQEMVCRSEDGKKVIRLPAQGLDKSDLMGELFPLAIGQAYQLALPFTPQAWREMMTLCNDLTGTTL